SFPRGTRARLPVLGYVCVALAVPALLAGPAHQRLQSALLTGALFGYLWFIASLRATLIRFDPDGFFASAVVLGGAAYVALQTIAALVGEPLLAAPSAACAAT